MEKILKETYTFDDVLLVPAKSDVLPNDVCLKTNLTKNIVLNIPILSAAMDTVTEAKLAIELARAGGLGFIHKNMSILEQAKHVDMVKRNESGMISDPITLSKKNSLLDADSIFKTYNISCVPIVDGDCKLLGIVTSRDLKYRDLDDSSLEFVMTQDNLISAPVGISLDDAKSIMLENRIEKLPIVNEDGVLKGLITIKDIDRVIDYPNACLDSFGRLRVGAAVGVGEDLLERVSSLVKVNVDVIVLDSAHGHSEGIIKALKEIKSNFKDLDVIVGNIVTKEAALDLINAGADALKVGIGPGSICTTRVVAGVGMPQLSAINEVYEVSKKYEIPVIGDGGIKLSGDITKAIAAGANCVMLGSLLAGSEEAPGEEVIVEGRKYKVYVGMGSLAAMARGSSDRYFQTSVVAKKLVPEGIEGRVPFKGKLVDIVYQLLGGLRSGMGYCGTKDIEDLKLNGRFVKITNAGLKESHPHDISLTKEAPNYNR